MDVDGFSKKIIGMITIPAKIHYPFMVLLCNLSIWGLATGTC